MTHIFHFINFTGLGYGLAFAPCSTIISYYFEKRRAFANGITVSASGIGAIGFPFIYRQVSELFINAKKRQKPNLGHVRPAKIQIRLRVCAKCLHADSECSDQAVRMRSCLCHLYHPHSDTLSHFHICTLSHFHMCTLSHFHMCTLSRVHMYTLSHFHMCTLSHFHMCTLSYVHMCPEL